MGFTKVDERTIISDSYAPYGELPQFPDRPEPPQRQAAWIDKKALKRRYGWSDADLDTVFSLGDPVKFPTSGKRTIAGSWGVRLVWKDVDLEKWEARMREHVTLLQGLLK